MMHKKRLLNCAVSVGMVMVIAGSLTGCGSKTYTFDYDSTRANNGVDALELLGYEFDIDEDDFTTAKLSGSTLTIEGYGSWKANKFNETDTAIQYVTQDAIDAGWSSDGEETDTVDESYEGVSTFYVRQYTDSTQLKIRWEYSDGSSDTIVFELD